MAPNLVFQVKQREKELVEWAADLQNKLEQSETTCYKLMEENGELKQEIENLATEVVEVSFKNIDRYFFLTKSPNGQAISINILVLETRLNAAFFNTGFPHYLLQLPKLLFLAQLMLKAVVSHAVFSPRIVITASTNTANL